MTLCLDKATRAYSAAANHIVQGDYDFASSRAYYAAFYAMTAALLTRNLTFSKHGGVIGAFGEHFIRPGTFPKDFGVKIARLFRERQLADYESGVSVTHEAASADVADAQAIVTAVADYLSQTGFSTPPI